MRNPVYLFSLLLLCLLSCEKDKPETAERGYIIATKQIKIYTPKEIQDLLNINKFNIPFTLEHNVKAIKIAYMTPDPDGKLVNATGALFIPETTGEFPVICFQHGTQTQRHLVPSLGAGNSDAGLAGAVAASMGYICVAADYLGLGESEIVPAFLLAGSSATTVIDMLRASLSWLDGQSVKTDGSLYLTGYSQGGYVTMSLHHELEKNYADEFSVSGSAPLAGPYDLVHTVDTILSLSSYPEPVLMANLMNSYDHYFEWNRLSEIFHEPYASDIPGYFDGSQMLDPINDRLPQSTSELLLEKFITDYKSGAEADIQKAFQDNSLLNYVPSAPVLLVHSDEDETAPYFNSLAALEFYQQGGKTNVELLTIKGSHKIAAEEAMIAAMSWIDSLHSNQR